VLQRDKITGQAITGMLNLVDLAGSERLKKSESQGVRLKEALHINTSLTALGKVIMALDPTSDFSHVPYRDSKLTRVLQNSLGGNSYTSVIAAIHPSPKYYEECLSTLQFANRCRNVRNNPRVNYVEDTEDKDRRIRKLNDEIGQLRSKLALHSNNGSMGDMKTMFGNNGNGSDDKLTLPRIISLLKKFGMAATIGTDGVLVVNGKKYTNDELGLHGSGGSTSEGNLLLESSMILNSNGEVKISKESMEKLQKIIKELKEQNENYSAKTKEKKTQNEEQGKEIQKLTEELIKCHTTIKHKEFEINSFLEEKDRSLQELKAILEAKHAENIKTLLSTNQSISNKQHELIQNIPKTLKNYSELIDKTEKNKISYEEPLKKDFEEYMLKIDKSRKTELVNIKNQYDYFLSEKDKSLSSFVENFNKYRTKKTEQLRMAEQEIVKLYDYTEKIEVILDNVEKGVYQVQKKQGTKGGFSTTGVLSSAITTRPHSSLEQRGGVNTGRNNNNNFDFFDNDQQQRNFSANPNNTHQQQFGSIMLPQGVRPINPLKIGGHHSTDLQLTKRIVEKHKERLEKVEKMKEEAFQKSLHFAAKTGASTGAAVDEELQKRIRGLLEVHNNNNNNHRNTIAPPLPLISTAATTINNNNNNQNYRPISSKSPSSGKFNNKNTINNKTNESQQFFQNSNSNNNLLAGNNINNNNNNNNNYGRPLSRENSKNNVFFERPSSATATQGYSLASPQNRTTLKQLQRIKETSPFNNDDNNIAELIAELNYYKEKEVMDSVFFYFFILYYYYFNYNFFLYIF
jgi:hypothetical protein